MNSIQCPICKNTAKSEPKTGDFSTIECPRCGRYSVSGTDFSMLENKSYFPANFRMLVSHKLRRAQRSDRIPDINTNTLKLWEGEELPNAAELCANFILWVGDASPSPGALAMDRPEVIRAEIGAVDHPDGLSFAVDLAKRRQWIDTKPDNQGQFCCKLTYDGWAEYGRLKVTSTTSRHAFMAMGFRHGDVRDALENAFRPAVGIAGFELRILTDDQPAGLIDDQLRVALRTSRFVVADLTYGNQGAYWEAGFAEGLGRPVFYTCEKKWFDDKEKGGTHFDTNHLNTVIWEYGQWDDAAKRLAAMIRATLPTEARLTDR